MICVKTAVFGQLENNCYLLTDDASGKSALVDCTDASDKMIDFIREVQYASPIDSFVACEPWAMPGYDDNVIMAAGTFVGGSSIELSADGPVKPPYIAYFQGGLTYEHGKYALQRILNKLC